jgi:uncharacterized protein (TIGR03905 family)
MEVYKTEGVCSTSITFEIRDGHVHGVRFSDGCDGNLKAISLLVEGMEVKEAVKRLQGIDCDGRGTSCPDQLATALKKYIGRK